MWLAKCLILVYVHYFVHRYTNVLSVPEASFKLNVLSNAYLEVSSEKSCINTCQYIEMYDNTIELCYKNICN